MGVLNRIAKGTEQANELNKQRIKGKRGLLSAIQSIKTGQPATDQKLRTTAPQPTPEASTPKTEGFVEPKIGRDLEGGV